MDALILWFKNGGWKTLLIGLAAAVALWFALKFWFVILPIAAVLYAARHWDTVKGWFTGTPPSTGPPAAV